MVLSHGVAALPRPRRARRPLVHMTMVLRGCLARCQRGIHLWPWSVAAMGDGRQPSRARRVHRPRHWRQSRSSTPKVRTPAGRLHAMHAACAPRRARPSTGLSSTRRLLAYQPSVSLLLGRASAEAPGCARCAASSRHLPTYQPAHLHLAPPRLTPSHLLLTARLAPSSWQPPAAPLASRHPLLRSRRHRTGTHPRPRRVPAACAAARSSAGPTPHPLHRTLARYQSPARDAWGGCPLID